MVGFTTGLLIGNGVSRLAGFTDEGVCSQQDATLTGLASVLNGVDCSGYESALAIVDQNADLVPVESFDPLTFHGVTVQYAYGVPNASATHNLLTCFNWSGTRPPGYGIQITVRGAGGSINYTGTNERNSYCGPASNSNISGWWVTAPLLSYQVTLWDKTWPFSDPTYVSDIVAGALVVPDPARQWRCTIVTAEGSYTETSDEFHETAPALAQVACPAVPFGETALNVTIEEIGGGQTHSVYDQDTTASFRDWYTAFPECRNGSCLLDLRHDGESCFFTTAVDDCDGWLSDLENFECWYGTHHINLSACFVYAHTFEPGSIAVGRAYSDPETGDSEQSQSSPTSADIARRVCKSKFDEVTAGGQTFGVVVGISRETWNTRCATWRIFVTGFGNPTTGQSHMDATLHDATAIVENPLRMFLTKSDRAPQPVWDRWYTSHDPCDQPPDNPPKDCDEFPYWSTEEGYGGLNSGLYGTPSLKYIDPEMNQDQGRSLGRFYSNCVATAEPPNSLGRRFIVIADPALPTIENLCAV